MTLLNKIKATAGIALLGFTIGVQAGFDTETDKNDVILAGHDAVAYFTDNKAIEGSAKFSAVHNDAIYHFRSAENRDTFKANPTKYAPQYGGFCAYGLTFGKKFEIDGKAFKVVDGKLYVNKNLDVAKAWKENIPKHLNEANGYWPKVEHTSAAKL